MTTQQIRDYKKLKNGDDSNSKKLVKDLFRHLYNIKVTITKGKYDYIDALFSTPSGHIVGLEIKDRRDKYYSQDFSDVMCGKDKYNKFLFDKNHPHCGTHKGIEKLLVVNIYKDNVLYIGDADSRYDDLTYVAPKTTEFGNNALEYKHSISVKRILGFRLDDFLCIYNAKTDGEYIKGVDYTLKHTINTNQEVK